MKACYLLLLVFLCACNTPYYTTVNNMGGQPATLNLKNGQVLTGKIQIRTFDNYSTISKIGFAEGISKEYKTYYLNEIDFLFFNGSNYSVRNLKGNEMWGGNAIRLVKELSPATGKLQLFEHETNTKSTDGVVHKETQLFVQLPGNQLDIFNAQSDKFIPNFDVKVATYLNACPTLCQLVKAKQQDYFYAFVNQGETRRKQVWMNIMNQFNQCK